ncbi:GTP-binding protein [Bacillus sp. RO3]|nr:GTP-binding protein [Bacillus sp. RO3]
MKRIPVLIVSGFLGSGKTTFLQHMIKHCQDKGWKPGIILNELGDENVEQHLFPRQKLHEILGGCVCCTLKDTLQDVLHDIIDQHKHHPIDLLIIEGTGVANPLELKEVVCTDEFTSYFTFHSIMTIVDATEYLDYKSVIWSWKEERTLMAQQVENADIVLLNKIDLIGSSKCKKIEDKLSEDIPGTKVVKTILARAPLGELISLSTPSKPKTIIKTKWTHHENIGSIKIAAVSPLDFPSLKKWLTNHPSIIRAKGVLQSKSMVPIAFQYSSGQFSTEPVENLEEGTIVLIGDKTMLFFLKEQFSQTFPVRKKAAFSRR